LALIDITIPVADRKMFGPNNRPWASRSTTCPSGNTRSCVMLSTRPVILSCWR